MSTVTERIEQWEKMTAEAPDDMSWFSLANAYREADRLDEAAKAYAEAIKLNPTMSRAYQLHGQVLIELGRDDEAAEVLTAGYEVAAQRGDFMPQKAIGEMLTGKLGRELPKVEAEAPKPPEVDPDDPNVVLDRRTGRPGARLPDPPMRGPLGKFIYENYSQETWREWIGQGTKVINELRLDFSNPDHQKAYEAQMIEWLEIPMDELERIKKEG